MAKHNYKIESTGSTTSSAEGGLTQKRNGLISKLAGAGAKTSLLLVKTEFIGHYSKHESNGDKIDVTATITSEAGWDELTVKADNKLNGSSGYETQFTKAEYFKLSRKQLGATTNTRPPAGLEVRQSYIGSDLSKLL